MARFVDDGMAEIIDSSDPTLTQWGDAVAQEVTDDIKLSFGTGAVDRMYKRGRAIHYASAPGYPPAVDTGALRASMHWKRVGKHKWRIQDGVECGIWLELGTTRIEPRPFLGPVILKWNQVKLVASALSFGLIKR